MILVVDAVAAQILFSSKLLTFNAKRTAKSTKSKVPDLCERNVIVVK